MCVIPDKIIEIKSEKKAPTSDDGLKVFAEHELNLNAVNNTFNNFIFQYDPAGNSF
jgi:hypothetical protein